MKICFRCKKEKTDPEFRERSAGVLHSWCKACFGVVSTQWLRDHPTAAKKISAQNRRKNSRRMHESYFVESYGIDFEDWARMYEACEGRCPGCTIKLNPNASGRRELVHVDHEHNTGKVRGLLCARCNLALGAARDDPNVLRSLARYLEVNAPSELFYSDQGPGSSNSDWAHDRILGE